MDRRQELQRLVRDLASLAHSQPGEALRRCQAILEQSPGLVPLLVLAARIERRLGQPEAAAGLLKRALDADPDAGPAHGELGMLAAAGGDYGAAARHFSAWAGCQPQLVDAWFNLGIAEERRGRFTAAADAYRRGLETPSGDAAEIRLRLAGVLALAGREPDARAQYETLLNGNREHLEARFGLGLIELAEGHADQALATFRACVERAPDCADAWQQILAVRRIEDPDDADLAAVLALLDHASLTPLARERLCFAAGKAMDDLGRYDEAFAAIRTANALRHARLPPYDPVAWGRPLANDVAMAVDVAGEDRREQPPRPVFIVGMPRSGTTLVDQILSAHSRATGIGEVPVLDPLADARADTAPTPDDLAAARAAYLVRLRDADADVVTNKYPANVRHLRLIWRLFPEAPVINVSRSALDTCLSIYCQDFPTGNLYANDFADIARCYRQYRNLLEQAAGDPRLLDVAYEDLLADPEGVSRRLVAHCGLPWEAGCLDFTANRRPVGTLSRWQVRQPLYRSSIGRWRHYRDHLGPLIEALGDYADVD